MQKLFLGLVFVVLSIIFASATVWATPATKAVWNESPEADAAGYYLYYGIESGMYPNAVKIEGKANHCYMLTDLPLEDGVKYYIAVTVYDVVGLESGYSNEIAYPALQSVTVSVEDDGEATIVTVVVPNCTP